MRQVTTEELNEIQILRESLIEIISTVGELHLSKHLAQKQVNQLSTSIELQEQRFTEFQEQERVLFEKLQQKYGTGNINMETGEIQE